MARRVVVAAGEWVGRWRLALDDLSLAGRAACLGALLHTLSEARRRVPRPGSPVGGCGSAARMGGAGVIRGLTVVSRWARRWRYISARGLGQA